MVAGELKACAALYLLVRCFRSSIARWIFFADEFSQSFPYGGRPFSTRHRAAFKTLKISQCDGSDWNLAASAIPSHICDSLSHWPNN